jgi:hypothetical protein
MNYNFFYPIYTVANSIAAIISADENIVMKGMIDDRWNRRKSGAEGADLSAHKCQWADI